MDLHEKIGQRLLILEALKEGKVSRGVFFGLGIACPSGRISELRALGHNIKCHELPRIGGKRRTIYELIK